VRQREVSGKRMRVLGRGYHDGIEVVRPIEDAPKVRELFCLGITLRRGIDRDLIDVAKHGDILIRVRRRRTAGF